MTEIKITDPDGFPKSVVSDYERADFKHKEATSLEYDTRENTITISWDHDNAGRKLHQWLEDTRSHYLTEYVDGKLEYQMFEQVADAVYTNMRV